MLRKSNLDNHFRISGKFIGIAALSLNPVLAGVNQY